MVVVAMVVVPMALVVLDKAVVAQPVVGAMPAWAFRQPRQL
jgi:hypothetical protein